MYTPSTATVGTTYYYAVVTGSCSSASSSAAAVTINTLTAITAQPSPTSQNLCQNTAASVITLSATGTSLSYQWYSNTTNTNSGGTAITGATASTYTPSTATVGTLYYYAVVTGSCNAVASNTSVVTVTAKSANPVSATASAATICAGSSTTLSLNGGGGGAGTIIAWYTGSCGGTLAGTGNNLVVTPSTTTTYYGRYEDGAPCNYTSACASITVSVNALPALSPIIGPAYLGTGKTIRLADSTTGGVWSVDNTSFATLSSTTANPVTLTGVAIGNPVVTYSLRSAQTGCTAATSTTIRVYNPASAYYITRQNGNYSQVNTWNINRSDGNGPVLAEVPPGNDDNITVKHDLVLDQNFSGSAISIFNMITGGTLTIQPNQYFSTAGTVDFGNNLVTIKSTAAGTGAIGAITNADGKIPNATNVRVERYINMNTANGNRSGRAWRLLTAPVTNTTLGASWQEGSVFDGTAYRSLANPNTTVTPPDGYGTNITGNAQKSSANALSHGYDFWQDIAAASSSIRYYAATSTGGSWASFASIYNQSISDQAAYMIFVRGDKSKLSPPNAGATTLRATGILKQGNQAATLPITQAFTLVGNPYASPIDFEKVYTASTNIRHQFQIWNANLGVYGAYQLVDGTDGAGNYTIVPTPIDGTPTSNAQYIASGSGFFVQTATAADSGVIRFTEAVKAPSQTVLINPYREVLAVSRKLYINLNIKTSDTSAYLADGVLAKFNDKFSADIDGYDAMKQNNFNENLSIYSHGYYLITEARPDVQKRDTVQLKAWNLTKRQYELQIQGDHFDPAANMHAYLEDAYLNTKKEISLLGGAVNNFDFTVTADSGSFKIDRFRVVFQNDAVVLPLTLMTVKATPQSSGGVTVNWSVSSEQNMKLYSVERSTDGGRSFAVIATQQPENKMGSAISTYAAFDAAPQRGTNLYRIRMEENGGRVSYSAVVKASIAEEEIKPRIALYPNPVQKDGKVTLQLSHFLAGNYTLSIFSPTGQNVMERKINVALNNPAQSENLSLGSNLAAGSYTLRLANNAGTILFTDKILVGN